MVSATTPALNVRAGQLDKTVVWMHMILPMGQPVNALACMGLVMFQIFYYETLMYT
jgi:hypothetical protein